MYKTILVPLDGSPLAEKAIPYVARIARGYKASIILLSVSTGKSEREKRSLAAYLKRKSRELVASGINTTQVTAFGSAPDQILDFAERDGVDLIVMSTHGQTGVSRWPAGSVSNKVIHESYIPLLLIKTGGAPPPPEIDTCWKIMVPLDGSESSEAALPFAFNLIAGSESEIILFGVNEAEEVTRYGIPEMEAEFRAWRQQARDGTQGGIQRYLNQTKGKLKSQEKQIHCQIARGKAAEEILSYAESNEVSVIAMTTQGQSGCTHWAFGSVANKVVQRTSKPILLLRPQPRVLIPNTQDSKTLPDN